MAFSIRTETETVIKKILPYLRRRGYDAEKDLDFETAVQTPERYAKGYVDILVTGGKPKPYFLVEAKKSSKKLNSKDRDQAISYGKGFKVPFVVVTNGSDIQCFNTNNKNLIRWNGKLTEKIPTKEQLKAVTLALKANKNAVDISLGTDNSLPFRPGLPLKQLNALFARCHNAIRKMEKNEEFAFADFSKLLFLKLLEEKSDTTDFSLPYTYRFHELADKPESESDQIQDAVLQMIDRIKAKTAYGEVLEDKIRLKNPKTFRYIVRQLSAVSFQDSSLDSKGAAFEYFVRATLKGKKLGQYFTPRPLVEVMSHLVGSEKIINSLLAGSTIKVLDPACGTGGFLVYLMQENLHLLGQRLEARQMTRQTHDEVAERIMHRTFFGSDANEGVAASAKMNMIIAGDGHTNIQAEDSLARHANNWKVENPDCNLILTNPPFGTSESSSLTATDLNDYAIHSTKGQHLFVQKMVLCSVKGGEICTVIDEGLLNTDTAKALRRWLFEKCQVVAVVSLPDETFKPNKINVKASLLYLRRLDNDDVDYELDYKVTFCELKSLGYAGSGDKIRGFNFPGLLNEISSQVLDHRLGQAREGYNWTAFDINSQAILADNSCRLDLKYWRPEIREQITELQSAGGRSVKELNLIETKRGQSPPAELYVDEEDGYALVVKAGTNISKFGRLITEGDYIEKNVYDEMGASHLQNGDVLLSSTGDGTLGKCCVYRSDEPAIADTHVTVIRVDAGQVNPEYLCDYLRVGFGSRQIERLFTGSTGLIELTPEHVDSIIVDLLSDTEEQKRISDALREREREYLETLQNAEASLSQAREQFYADKV
jgi:type I restriction enzyme M protein